MYVNFWELIIAFPNGGQWAPFNKVCPLAQTSTYATADTIHRQHRHIGRYILVCRYIGRALHTLPLIKRKASVLNT